MRAEINPRDGYIHGTVLADAPFVDSPLLDLEIEDRHHFVVRMAYDGACAQAGLHLERRGAPVTPKTNPKAPFVNPIVVRFPITSDGSQHVYYAPLFPYVQGDISRIRFFPCLSGNDGRHQGNTFHIDWIMVAKAPTVTKVRGCIDRYSQVPLLQPLLAPSANISMITTLTNGIHPVFSTLFHAMILPFASTYNCYPGDEITVQGRNFGDAALVHINGAPCQNNYPTLESIPELASDAPDEEVLTCVLPANLPRGPAVVTVTNERYRGLVFNGTMVAYAVPSGRARGGDGFAFVIQNEGGASIGRGGHEVGYGGIRNAVSVEFDTTYNADTADMYENHVSIHTRGRSQPNSAHHAYSLGATSEPFAPHFQASAYVSQFFAKTTGASAWGSAGVGCLQVTVDDRTVLSVPLHLDNTLDLTGGRAFVGFTAATGAVAWQAHDILSWQWESLRMFPLPPAPFTHV
ncbi:hypothetical protein B5M09_009294 [Aphanomyces astaci]|uniref:Uncharacterized protein n=1 Tax=Aphanomyces astaci TaxID=112090 RepID=A0A425DBA7_APHAT|nr:hypothetical protein B5M09_009294 [Aphanomyces astaci]